MCFYKGVGDVEPVFVQVRVSLREFVWIFP